MLRPVRSAGIAALLAAYLGSGLATNADAKRPPACITKLVIRQQEDFSFNDSPYLKVNTKFWEVDSLKRNVWHTVFRTVHVGDVVQAWDHDALDPDDFIGSDTVGGGSGTLFFAGDGAKYRARYHGGAC